MMPVGKKVIKSSELPRKSGHESVVRDSPPRERAAALIQQVGGVMNKRVLDAQAQAEDILSAAEADAEHVRAEAQDLLSDVEATHAAAKERGFAEGREAGLAAVTEQLATLERRKEEFFAQAEPEIVKLVLQCTEKVFGRVVDAHRQVVVDVVRQAIAASIGDRIVVSVAPSDYAVITQAEDELRGLLDRTKRIHFKEDESVSPGGCVLETEIGTIDARLETQLKAIKKAFDL